MKTEGKLQLEAIAWARGSVLLCALGVAAVSVATPVSQQIFDKWRGRLAMLDQHCLGELTSRNYCLLH